jgi:hypothetical protein
MNSTASAEMPFTPAPGHAGGHVPSPQEAAGAGDNSISFDENPFEFNDSHIQLAPSATPRAAGPVSRTGGASGGRGGGGGLADKLAAAAKVAAAANVREAAETAAEEGEQEEQVEDQAAAVAAAAEPCPVDTHFRKLLGRLDNLLRLYSENAVLDADEERDADAEDDLLKAACASAVERGSPVYVQGKDALKMLHAMATACVDEGGGEEEGSVAGRVLGNRADELSLRLASVVRVACSRVGTPHGLDANLLALSLAVVYALLQVPAFTASVGAGPLRVVLERALIALPDKRLADVGGDRGGGSSSADKLVGALNMVVLQAVQRAPRGLVFTALLSLLRRCCPGAGGSARPLSEPSVAKLVVRLFLKVLKKEAAAAAPFAGVDVQELLRAGSCFFNQLAADKTAGAAAASVEAPLKAANTMLRVLLQSVGMAVLKPPLDQLQMEADCAGGGPPAGLPIAQVIRQHVGHQVKELEKKEKEKEAQQQQQQQQSRADTAGVSSSAASPCTAPVAAAVEAAAAAPTARVPTAKPAASAAAVSECKENELPASVAAASSAATSGGRRQSARALDFEASARRLRELQARLKLPSAKASTACATSAASAAAAPAPARVAPAAATAANPAAAATAAAAAVPPAAEAKVFVAAGAGAPPVKTPLSLSEFNNNSNSNGNSGVSSADVAAKLAAATAPTPTPAPAAAAPAATGAGAAATQIQSLKARLAALKKS